MYKRTIEAIARKLPPPKVVAVKAQFGMAKYSEIAYAVTTRVDASGAYAVQVMEEKTLAPN